MSSLLPFVACRRAVPLGLGCSLPVGGSTAHRVQMSKSPRRLGLLSHVRPSSTSSTSSRGLQSTCNMAHDADCIIIGAGTPPLHPSQTPAPSLTFPFHPGFAGLSAASHLSGSASVLVLEARPRLGGRAYTYDMKVGAVDLGAHFIHGYKEGNPMGDVAKRLGVVRDLAFEVHHTS